MMSNPRVLVAVPTYNEIENIDLVIGKLQAVPAEFEILIVDDNSPDGTSDRVVELQKTNPKLHLLKRSGKLGIGSAHQDAIAWAYNKNYTILVTMDADGTHDPKLIPEFLQKLEFADVVIGSRYLRINSLPGWNRFRKFLTHAGHFATCFFLKMDLDATGAFRAYDLTRVPGEAFRLVGSRGYSFFYESLYVLWKSGFRIVEVPLELPARTYGHSKMSLRQIVISVLRLVLIYTNTRVSPELFIYREKYSPPVENGGQLPSSPWDRYWGSQRADSPIDLGYELLATWFRTFLIRPYLDHVMHGAYPDGAKLLHAGCGSGQVDRNLRHAYKIEAVDSSLPAVERYHQINHPYASARTADIRALPFEENSFDGIYNLGVMEHFTEAEIRSTLAEFSRVLRPGGKLVMFWPRKSGIVPFVLKIFQCIEGWFSSEEQESIVPPEISRLSSIPQLEGWLNVAGLKFSSASLNYRDLFTQYAVVAEKPPSAAK